MTNALFVDSKCRVCGHLRGDHEALGMVNLTDTNGLALGRAVSYTCDDDCDEDLNGYCHVGRLFND